MIRTTKLMTMRGANRGARREIGAAWEHLLVAADLAAKQFGQGPRRGGGLARERATTAALALRPAMPTRWRWMAGGMAGGILVGSAGAAALSRRRREPDKWRRQATETMDTVRERTGEAMGTARETAGGVREHISGGRNPQAR
jgi:hypothetical protein